VLLASLSRLPVIARGGEGVCMFLRVEFNKLIFFSSQLLASLLLRAAELVHEQMVLISLLQLISFFLFSGGRDGEGHLDGRWMDGVGWG
jgi:hypothetical protein